MDIQMKRNAVSFMAAIVIAASAGVTLRADEGLWLPALISQRIDDMQANGFKLTAEDIYSINQASLKDAVAIFGGGCSSELVSGEGLLLTNHHCGYSQIQQHSTVEHDYLKDGFWAMNRKEELPNPGLTVSFLDRMVDVSSIMLKADDKEEAAKALVAEAVKDGNGLKASVEPLYYGNQYFLFVYREYRDVRLVGAPPSSIGKFGGDTDNWVWPRHTGDFSIFRVYADKDNNPADYSEDNVPYHPKKYFTISRRGVSEGDFTMIFGCPGTTQEYILSDGVRYTQDVSDPMRIDIRTRRLDIQKKYMSQSQDIRIRYSAKNASVANAWKKWQGEVGGLKRNSIIERKVAYEAGFNAWTETPEGAEYKGLTSKIDSLYQVYVPYMQSVDIFLETAWVVEIAKFSSTAAKALDKDGGKDYPSLAEQFYDNWYMPIDKESFVAEMNALAEYLPEDRLPEYYKSQVAAHGGVEGWADYLFDSSLFADPQQARSLTSADLDKVKSDPAYEFYSKFMSWYYDDLYPDYSRMRTELAGLYKAYMRGQMAYEPGRTFYPDANSTMRISYGKVSGYSPADGIWYNPVSTLTGIIEKDNPEIFDYNIPQVLRDIYAKGGHEDQPVCFLATNHTSGGNSGSPVINAYGELIGINFDRVWEGTMSDIAFDPDYCRNISLDIRYLLFLIDKVGGASYLFDEMSFAD